MWNLADSIRRTRTFAIGAAILSILPLLAQEAEVVHVRWDNLSMVTGRTVRIALPGGVITGKALGVEAEALVVDVKSATNPTSFPKGMHRVPREQLHLLEMQRKGRNGRRILGSSAFFRDLVQARRWPVMGSRAATLFSHHTLIMPSTAL